MYSLVTIPAQMTGNSVTLYVVVKDGSVVASSSNYSSVAPLVTAANL
jgi:hypothetical protein